MLIYFIFFRFSLSVSLYSLCRAHSSMMRYSFFDTSTSRLMRFIEDRIKKIINSTVFQKKFHFRISRISDNDIHFLYKMGSLVLKAPCYEEGKLVEKGVIILKFGDNFRTFYRSVHVESVLNDYMLVLEPSFNDYASLDILCFARFPKQPVVVLAKEKRCFQFIKKLQTNLVPIELGANDWVNPEIFHKIENEQKIYDTVMVARWWVVKRHHVLFHGLRQLNDPLFKVALVSVEGKNRKEIDALIDWYGVKENIDIYEGLPQEAVNRILNQSKVNLLLSLHEGNNKSVYEGFFAGVPALVLKNTDCVAPSDFNHKTGRLIHEDDLLSELLYFRSNWADYDPREWAEENITPVMSTERLGRVLKNIALDQGEMWAQGLAVKYNSPGLTHYPDKTAGRHLPTINEIITQYGRERRDGQDRYDYHSNPMMVENKGALRVSVIIPSYNNADYIEYSVKSVLEQDYTDYDIIVIDDGSTDHTKKVLEPYMDRIQYVFQENQGVSAARNKGLSLANGRYIVFLDSDDVMLPGKLAEQAEMLDNRPMLGCIHSGWHIVDSGGEITNTIEPWHNAQTLDLKTWLMWKPVRLGAMMIRRFWIDVVGGFDINLSQAEDTDLLLNMSLKGCIMDWHYRPTINYRLHAGNITLDGLVQAESSFRMIDRFFSNPAIPNHIRKLEMRIRYYSAIWDVWALYVSGNTENIVDYLRRSMIYNVGSVDIIVQNWFAQMVRHCGSSGQAYDTLRFFLPYFKKAVNTDEKQWTEIELVINWWLDVWVYYLKKEYTTAYENMKQYQDIPEKVFCRLIKSGIVVSPDTVTEVEITRALDDAASLGMIKGINGYAGASAYMTALGQAVLRGERTVALNAFKRAVQCGFQPAVINAWRDFFYAGAIYFISGWKMSRVWKGSKM